MRKEYSSYGTKKKEGMIKNITYAITLAALEPDVPRGYNGSPAVKRWTRVGPILNPY
jgi:hypothetical protein